MIPLQASNQYVPTRSFMSDQIQQETFDLLFNQGDIVTLSNIPGLKFSSLLDIYLKYSGKPKEQSETLFSKYFQKQNTNLDMGEQFSSFKRCEEFCTTPQQKQVRFGRFFSKYLVQGGDDNCCKVVDIPSAKDNYLMKNVQKKEEVHNYRSTYYGHRDRVTDGIISQTHELLISCSHDTDFRCYDMKAKENNSLVYSFSAGDRINSMDFLSSSQLILSTKKVMVYDLQVYKPYFTVLLEEMNPITKVRVNKLQNVGYIVDKVAHFIDPRSSTHIYQLLGDVSDFCFIGDYQIAIASYKGGYIYDTRNQAAVSPLEDVHMSVSTMYYDNFIVGLNSEGKIVIYQNMPNCRKILYDECKTLSYRHNLIQIAGNPSAKQIAYVLQKQTYISDIE